MRQFVGRFRYDSNMAMSDFVMTRETRRCKAVPAFVELFRNVWVVSRVIVTRVMSLRGENMKYCCLLLAAMNSVLAFGQAIPSAPTSICIDQHCPPPVIVQPDGMWDFESGDLRQWQTEFGGQGIIEVQPVIRREGHFGLRVELDRTLGANYRAEVVPKGESIPLRGEWRYYGFSIYLDPPYKVDDTGWEIVTQWHGRPAPGQSWATYDGGGPPLSLNTTGGRWYVHRKWDATLTNQHHPESERIDIGPYEVGQWVDWVFAVKWDWTESGYLKVWKNGKLVIDRAGAIGYNDGTSLPYFKMGLYKGWKSNLPYDPQVTDRTVFYGPLRISSGDNASYDVVKSRP
jgi:hypothetical protein